MGVWLGIEAAGEEYILRYAYKYNKIFIIQHQRCLGTLPAGSSAVSMLISCEIPNKHIFSSFSHLTLCLWNKSVTLVVKSAASPFSDPDHNQMFNFCLVVGMVEAYMYVCMAWHPTKFSSFLSNVSSMESTKYLAASLSPGIVSRQASHEAVFSWSAKHIPKEQNCLFFSFSLFHEVPNAPVFSFFHHRPWGFTQLRGIKTFPEYSLTYVQLWLWKQETSTKAIRSQTGFKVWRQTYRCSYAV